MRFRAALTIFLVLGATLLACKGEEKDFPASFTRYDGNPILRSGTGWDAGWLHPYSVLQVGHEYWMWYGGVEGEGLPTDVGLAFSDDGLSWHRYVGNPIFSPQPDAWDNSRVEHLTVLEEDGRFVAWYAGDAHFDRRFHIGYAESSDGISWSRSPEPVLSPGPLGSWDDHFVTPAAVLREGNEYRMYYWGEGDVTPWVHTWKMGLATSSDGVNWEKYADNPVFEGRSDSWDVGVLDMDVVKAEDTYYMVYQGNEEARDRTRLGFAMSSDGIHWQRSEEPFFDNGVLGSWDGQWTEGPTLLQVDDGWIMLYMGSGGSGRQQIGVAISK